MKQRMLAIGMSLGLLGATLPAPVRANYDLGEGRKIKHVLLISVDGLHALDVTNYLAANPDSALTELSRQALRTPMLALLLFRTLFPAFWPW